jgi:hypothetical protein
VSLAAKRDGIRLGGFDRDLSTTLDRILGLAAR